MPFSSKAQQRYLYAKKPKVAEKFASKTSPSKYKTLPEYAGRSKKKKGRRFTDIIKNIGF